jgi:hypothetical protein
MGRIALSLSLGIGLAVLSSAANAQVDQNTVTPSFPTHSSNSNNALQPGTNVIQPANETTVPSSETTTPSVSSAPASPLPPGTIQVLPDNALPADAAQPGSNEAQPPGGTTPDSGGASDALTSTATTHAKNEPEEFLDPASLIPGLPPLPKENASLIGGTVQKLDRVRDQIVVRTFGGGSMKIAFDPRTHIYHGSDEGSVYDLKVGERIYLDTILDGDVVFARNIRVKGVTSAGESQGTVLGYRSDRGELLLRDALSPRTLKIRISDQTRIVKGDRNAAAWQLEPGTLVAVKFGPDQTGSDVAREVSILAVPGASFTFAGEITAINLRLGIIVITSSTDHKTYEIYVDPSLLPGDNSVHEASDITVVARFDGSRYVARSVTVNAAH